MRILVVVGCLLLATACSSSEPDPDPETAPTPSAHEGECPDLATVANAPALAEGTMLETVDGSPNIDRTLRITQGEPGTRCAAMLVGHADTDPDVVGYRIYRVDPGSAGEEWSQEGEDPSDMAPVPFPDDGCVRIAGEQTILGADGEELVYRGQVSVGC